MKQLVIDLRSNPGVLFLTVLSPMVDYILPDDMKKISEKGDGKTLIVYTADKTGMEIPIPPLTDMRWTRPIAILVNENSASASEVFTGAQKIIRRL